MLRTISRLLITAAIACSIAACSSRPSNVLDKEDMAELLADIHVAEGVAETNSRSFPSDSTKRELRASVLKRHKVTQEEFDSSLSWYGYNIERYVEVYDRVIELLEKRLAKAEENAGATIASSDTRIAMEGDSVDVWTGVRYRRLAAGMPSEYISYNLTSDPNWEKGDVYTLKGKLIDNQGSAEAMMVAEYTDGTVDYNHKQMHGGGWQEISLVLDSVKTARNVYGYIHYKPAAREVAYIDSISLYRSRYGAYLRPLRQSQQHFLNRTKTGQRPTTPTVTPQPTATDMQVAPGPQPQTAVKRPPVNGAVMRPQEATPSGKERAIRPGELRRK